MSDLSTPGVEDPSGYEASRLRRRKTYLIAAVSLAALAIISVVYAASSSPSSISGKVDTSDLPDAGPTPKVAAAGWLNSPPLTTSALKGKVVVYDFWTYSCINCLRTFPKIRALYDRYRRDGLVVVGVHSPEFDFEKRPGNVKAATKRLHVTWPVALDPSMTIWDAFNNRYWPADYIADRTGHIRYQHFGEGDYDNTENVVRKLLGVEKSAPRADERVEAETASGHQVNPETYLDLRHQQIEAQSGVHLYPDPGTIAAPAVALAGAWEVGAEHSTSAAAGATIVAGVHAQSVNLVLASKNGKPTDVVILLDGKPVPVAARGASVHDDGTGQTVVTVGAPDMYRLVLTSSVEDHELRVVAQQPGVEAYAFTFG